MRGQPQIFGAVVEAKAISRRFGRMQALDRVDLRIDRGEIVGYVGPNGSGKTTTMRALLGLVRLDAGELRLFGRDIRSEFWAIGPHLGAVFDQHALHAELTVRETLNLYARLFGIPSIDRRRRVDEVIETMGLGERAGARAKTLSKGLQQRLAFGRAIIHSPALLLLDEPFDGIDTETHRHLRILLRDLVGDGTSIFLTSHDLHEVDQLATRVVILDRGRVVASGTPAQLKRGAGGAGISVQFQESVTADIVHAALAGVAGREDIEIAAGGLQATIRPISGVPVDVVAARLMAAGLRVRQFQPQESTLEDAYFAHLQGHATEESR
jgi:ABC-type multidrug transport system ATPase subunit